MLFCLVCRQQFLQQFRASAGGTGTPASSTSVGEFARERVDAASQRHIANSQISRRRTIIARSTSPDSAATRFASCRSQTFAAATTSTTCGFAPSPAQSVRPRQRRGQHHRRRSHRRRRHRPESTSRKRLAPRSSILAPTSCRSPRLEHQPIAVDAQQRRRQSGQLLLPAPLTRPEVGTRLILVR